MFSSTGNAISSRVGASFTFPVNFSIDESNQPGTVRDPAAIVLKNSVPALASVILTTSSSPTDFGVTVGAGVWAKMKPE